MLAGNSIWTSLATWLHVLVWYVHSTYLLPETSLAFQHGKENSAHKEGMKIMIDEIEYLSKEDLDKGHIMVS